MDVLEYLQPVKLASRLGSALALIVGHGDGIQVLGEDAVKLQIARSAIDELATRYRLPDCSGKSFVRACEELERRQVVGILRVTKPWTYVVSLRALARLESTPVDPLASLPIFLSRGGGRDSPGQAGTGPRVRDSNHIQNPCSVSYRVRDRVTGAGENVSRPLRPWDRRTGYSSEDLVAAIETGDLQVLRDLYREGLMLEWIDSSEDSKLRFLVACHHAATAPGLRNRMGALVARVRRNIDVHGCRGISEDWAAGVLRSRERSDGVGALAVGVAATMRSMPPEPRED